MNLSSIIQSFENNVKQFVVNNADKIKFTHPQYTITKIGPGNYDITLSITGMGTQHFSLAMIGEEFTIKGRLAVLGSGSSFPFSIVEQLVNGMVKNWLTQSVESIAVSKAKAASADATLSLGKPVNALITLLPPGTTEANINNVTPQKKIFVQAPDKPVSTKEYKK